MRMNEECNQMRSKTVRNPHCTSVTMDMSMRKQMTQQMAATTSRRREPRADLGGSMSMIPVIKPSTPTNWKKRVKRWQREWERGKVSERGQTFASSTNIICARNLNVCWIYQTKTSRKKTQFSTLASKWNTMIRITHIIRLFDSLF